MMWHLTEPAKQKIDLGQQELDAIQRALDRFDFDGQIASVLLYESLYCRDYLFDMEDGRSISLFWFLDKIDAFLACELEEKVTEFRRGMEVTEKSR